MRPVDRRGYAERVLRHYLRTVWQRAGLQWDTDNDAEVGSVVDAFADMIDQAVEQAIREHLDDAPHLGGDS
jgi:hypothetical protein